MNKKSRSAFSLIEMLVAVVLLTLLLGVAMFSFRHLLIIFHQMKSSGIDNTIAYHTLRSSMESMKHYVVEEYDRLNQPTKNLYFYFLGDEHRMRFITNSANFSDSTSLVEITCIENSLIYKEEKLYGPIDFRRPDFSSKYHEKRVYEDLEYCQFNYYTTATPYRPQTQLFSEVPKFVELKMQQANKNLDIFIAIKSDNNLSAKINYSQIYDE